MKAPQSAADRLCGHGLGALAPDELIAALAIKADCRLLHLRGAQDEFHEAEFSRARLGTLQHALRDALAAIAGVKIHAPQLRAVVAAAFDPEHADDFVTCFNDPE